MSTTWGFKHIKNKHTLYRGKDCMKTFCESLKEHAIKKNVAFNKQRVKSTRGC